ncbi:MAG: hypothetical protein ACREBV_02800 [Candidatus Zixiibacteriota bacterium]
MGNLKIWLLSGLVTGLSVAAHYAGPTSMHGSNRDWERTVQYHGELQSFKNRPLTTNVVIQLVEKFHLTYRTAFFSLQFLLFFLTGRGIYFYLRQLGFSNRYSMTGMLLFMLSMPVFLAHLEPIHTWSDFWVYLLAPLSLGLAIQRKVLLSSMCMAVALLEYEIAWLLLPALYLFTKQSHDGRHSIAAISNGIALGLYFVLVFLTVGFEPTRPTGHLTFNFETALRTSDSLFSLFVSLGFLWVTGIFQVFKPAVIAVKYFQTVRFNAVLTALGFVGATFLFGGARESRHFVLPAFFLIPLTLWYFQKNRYALSELVNRTVRTRLFKALWILMIAAASVSTVMILFPNFEYRRWVDINRAYMSIHFAVVIILVAFELFGAKAGKTLETKTR